MFAAKTMAVQHCWHHLHGSGHGDDAAALGASLGLSPLTAGDSLLKAEAAAAALTAAETHPCSLRCAERLCQLRDRLLAGRAAAVQRTAVPQAPGVSVEE